MAVFPDRIVLKNSTDAEAAIITAIESGGTDEITQGEIVLGINTTDVKFYTKAGDGSIVSLGGTAFEVVGDLTPQLGGNLDVNGNYIVSASGGDVVIAPDTTGGFVVRGNDTDGSITLNCTANTHGVTIQAPPHSDAATYTLTLPSSAGTAGQVLTSQGGSQLTWEDAATGGSTIQTLSDVGDVLSYAGISPVGTWNDEIVTITTGGSDFPDAAGEWASYEGSPPGTSYLMLNLTDSNSVDHSTLLDLVVANPTDYSFKLRVNGGSVTPLVTLTAATLQSVGAGRYRLDFNTSDLDPATYNQGGYSTSSPSGGGNGPFSNTLELELRLTTAFTSPVADGEVLTWVDANNRWEPVAPSGGGASIDDLTDVDTTTTPPTQDQVLVWNGTSWVPGDQTGNGGSIAGTILQKEETQTASAGAATFTELGESGLLVSLSTTADAWVVLYPTAADRTADASRAYGDDPAPGSGVLAEFYVTTSGAVLASPGTTYFNNDTVSTNALYAAVRDQAGANVAADITIKAYVHQGFGGVGTARTTDSGTAASGLLTLTGMGQTGQFCTVTSSLDAWVVFYGSEADRTADNARAFATDPTPGSGVQAEFYIAAGTTVLATPGSTYFNNDTNPTDAMYLAVRDTGGSAVNSLVTVTVYAETSYTGISGGTFGSG